MVPQKKIIDLIKKHAELEIELSSGKVDKKLFADKSKVVCLFSTSNALPHFPLFFIWGWRHC